MDNKDILSLNKILIACSYPCLTDSEIAFLNSLKPSLETLQEQIQVCYNVLLGRFSKYSNVLDRLQKLILYAEANNIKIKDLYKAKTKANFIIGITS